MSGGGGITVFDVLAAVGAVAGVPALFWQIYTWRRSGPHVKVSAKNTFHLVAHPPVHMFSVVATNKGRAAAVVRSWGLRAPDGSSLISTLPVAGSDSLPATVAPFDSATFYIEGRHVRTSAVARGYEPRQFRPFVVLATGRTVIGGPMPWDE